MSTPENVIGWGSTAILIATLCAQIAQQLATGKASNVSPWLFVGQCAASLGFIAYSALVGNAVFVVSNALILLTALCGEGVRRRLVNRARRRRPA